MPVLYLALVAAVAIVLLFRKARFHYERIPKIPYVMGANEPAEGDWIVDAPENASFARVFLSSAAEYADDEKLDRLTILLKNEPAGVFDRIVEPYAAAVAFTGLRYGKAPYADAVLRRAKGGSRSRVVRAEHMGTIRGRQPFLWKYMMGHPLSAVMCGLSAALFAMWLPLLVLLALSGLNRHAALFALLPILVLFPWYRNAFGLSAPLALYLIVKPSARNGVS